MRACETCGKEIGDEQMHLLNECLASLHDRIDELEDENRGLKEAVEAYKRRLKKITATAPPSVV